MYNRITGTMLTGSTLTDINSALAKLQRSSNELSSGRKILEPSDNPYGASRSIDLQSQLDGLSSYTSSVNDGVSWTQTAGGSLAGIGQALQRVRQLLISAGNATTSQADLSNIATEVTQLTEAIKQGANTQYAGQYVFAGTLTSTPPYAHGENDEYQGNTGTVSRSIGAGATVQVNSDLSSILGNGKGAADGKTARCPADDRRAPDRRNRGRPGRIDDDRPQSPHHEHRRAPPAGVEQRQRDQPAPGGGSANRIAAGHDHGRPVGHPQHRYCTGDDRLLDAAGRLPVGPARLCDDRPGITAQLPPLAMQGEPDMSITFESVRFGTVEVPAEDVIEFPDGLIGLGGLRYTLLDRNPGTGFLWLHCVDDPALALPVIAPQQFFADFSLTVNEDDHERLGLQDLSAARVLRHGPRHAQPARHHGEPAGAPR